MSEAYLVLPEGSRNPVEDLPYAHGCPYGHGLLKSQADDFRVEEILAFECAGEGEHVFLQIEKIGCHTQEVALDLSKFARVPLKDIGFAGLKDKNAVARQWFSVRLPRIADPDWADYSAPAQRILALRRHHRKLRRGVHAANRFQIRLRALDAAPDCLNQRLARVRELGVPNYFGAQRFGFQGSNLRTVMEMFAGSRRVKGRVQRSMLLSAARSFLFNQILAERVRLGCWDRAIPGDILIFDGSGAFFQIAEPSDCDRTRLEGLELHPSGVLWGRGGSHPSLDALSIESRILGGYPEIGIGLEKYGLEMARRALRLCPRDLKWSFRGQDLELEFVLTSGGYATSVLRELIQCIE